MQAEKRPLAERMRPDILKHYVGQQHLVGPQSILFKAIKNKNIPSMILWGPPGVGKTTLAFLMAKELDAPFFTLSAISSGVKDIREVLAKAQHSEQKSVLFIDEIHRFNKAQQDSLLGTVEKGEIILIGATTENPSFEVISPLLSRCQVYILKELAKEELLSLLQNAIIKDIFLQKKEIIIKENEALLLLSGGDARKLLNVFELVINSEKKKKVIITNQKVSDCVQKNIATYDKNGEQHYDIISAYIKSIRGSDPNAAIYWLARMLQGGEDPKFIARRLLILASEDIGNANPNALLLATNCFQAVAVIGYPECQIILSQVTAYLATSAKSNAAITSIMKANDLVQKTPNLPVPLHLRNAPTKLMKEIGYGDNYQYSHNYNNNFSLQEYLPKELSGTKIYEPGNNPRENEIRNYLKKLWNKYKY